MSRPHLGRPGDPHHVETAGERMLRVASPALASPHDPEYAFAKLADLARVELDMLEPAERQLLWQGFLIGFRFRRICDEAAPDGARFRPRPAGGDDHPDDGELDPTRPSDRDLMP